MKDFYVPSHTESIYQYSLGKEPGAVGFSVRKAAKFIGVNKNAVQNRVKFNSIPYFLVNGRAFILDDAVILEQAKKKSKKNVRVYICLIPRHGAITAYSKKGLFF